MCGCVSSPTCSLATLTITCSSTSVRRFLVGERGVRDGAEEGVAHEDPDHRDDRDPEERAPDAGDLRADEQSDEHEDRVEPEGVAHEPRLEPVDDDRLGHEQDDRDRERRRRRRRAAAPTIGGMSASGGPKNGMSISQRADRRPQEEVRDAEDRADHGDEQGLHDGQDQLRAQESAEGADGAALEEVGLVAVVARHGRAQARRGSASSPSACTATGR